MNNTNSSFIEPPSAQTLNNNANYITANVSSINKRIARPTRSPPPIPQNSSKPKNSGSRGRTASRGNMKHRCKSLTRSGNFDNSNGIFINVPPVFTVPRPPIAKPRFSIEESSKSMIQNHIEEIIKYEGLVGEDITILSNDKQNLERRFKRSRGNMDPVVHEDNKFALSRDISDKQALLRLLRLIRRQLHSGTLDTKNTTVAVDLSIKMFGFFSAADENTGTYV